MCPGSGPQGAELGVLDGLQCSSRGWAVLWLCCGGAATPCITLAPCSCQSAGDQLSQELERVKKELEQVKGELGMWSWLF